MFDFLKRLVAPAPRQTAQRSQSRPAPKRKRSRDESLAVPPPPPEVVEGNSEQDWALWEDSVAMLDSQMQPLASRASGYDQLPSSQFDDPDAFARVRKRDR